MTPIMRQILLSGRRAKTIILDSFNRADNILTLGSADTGQVWSALRGTWGIASNQAALITADGVTNDIAVVEAGKSNVIVTCDIKYEQYAGLVIRAVDYRNFINVRLENAALRVYTFEAGATTATASYATTFTADVTYNIKVKASGSTIIVYLNNVAVLSTTVTAHQTATKNGFRVVGLLNCRFDNFKVEAI